MDNKCIETFLLQINKIIFPEISVKFGLFQNTRSESLQFLPRCMECERGVAMKILSVRLSVRLSNA